MPADGSKSVSLMMFDITVDRVTGSLLGSVIPKLTVKECCASASKQRTLFPCRASPAPRLVAVIVLPTPPFMFDTVIVLPIQNPPVFGGARF